MISENEFCITPVNFCKGQALIRRMDYQII